MRGLSYGLVATLALVGVGLLSCGGNKQMATGLQMPPAEAPVLKMEDEFSGESRYQAEEMQRKYLSHFTLARTGFISLRATYDYKVEKWPEGTFFSPSLNTKTNPENETVRVTARMIKDSDGQHLTLYLKSSASGSPLQQFVYKTKVDLYGHPLKSNQDMGLFESIEGNRRQLIKLIFQGGSPSVAIIWRYFINEPDAVAKIETEIEGVPPADENSTVLNLSVLQEALIIPLGSTSSESNAPSAAGNPGTQKMRRPKYTTAAGAANSNDQDDESSDAGGDEEGGAKGAN